MHNLSSVSIYIYLLKLFIVEQLMDNFAISDVTVQIVHAIKAMQMVNREKAGAVHRVINDII
jgi:hypothetical protein